ncbi:MAG: rhomboid family intramembrane serine protease, partial [Candidatus Krumholzibacteriaceae bacterium]
MFLPLKDINPTRRRPIATYSLIAANVAVFIYQLSLGARLGTTFVASYGATPYEITHLADLVGKVTAGTGLIRYPGPHPVFLTLFTSMFIHGGFAHIAGNMLFLWIFGNNVEDILGPF